MQRSTSATACAVFTALLFAAACHKENAETAAATAAPEAPSAAPAASAHEAKGEGHKHPESNRAYSLPFVRDPDVEDPTDRARGFLRQVIRDNSAFAHSHDWKYFKPFADTQKPRATIVTCSDSRVQTPSFDSRPDNDLFTIRNIGNQLGTAEGSVEYGVGHLKTPMLLILGHSGCGAVKAAMGDFSKQPEAVKHEIESIDLSPLSPSGAKDEDKHAKEGHEKPAEGEKPRSIDNQAWIEAVVVNVHHQVATALDMYAQRVSDHELIVVGAVYDFRNDMRQGYGSLNIVNVNGHTDAAKISAFTKAIDDMPGAGALSEGGPVANAGSTGSINLGTLGAFRGGGSNASSGEGRERGGAEQRTPERSERTPERSGSDRTERGAERPGADRGERASAERTLGALAKAGIREPK